jgi:molecular chaperone HtpG
MKRLAASRTAAPEKAALVAAQVLDNALISAGLLEDPTTMVKRLYQLLEQV